MCLAACLNKTALLKYILVFNSKWNTGTLMRRDVLPFIHFFHAQCKNLNCED